MKKSGFTSTLWLLPLLIFCFDAHAIEEDSGVNTAVEDDAYHKVVSNYYLNNRSLQRAPSTKMPQRRVIRAMVATGFNDVLGRPAFDLGEPFGTFGFTSMGIYNASGEEPLPLDPYSRASDLLATSVHPNFLALAGKTREAVKPEWENIPLRDVPVNTDFAFVNRVPLRGEMEAEPLEVAQSEPAQALTLGQWMNASGVARIECKSNDEANLVIRAKNLIPNRMYGVWATLGGEYLSSFPIGGVPNMFVTDERGSGRIERTLNFCPLDPASASRPILVLNVVYYSSHQNFGAVPEPVFVDGFWLGTVTHNHLQFPVNVDLLRD